ncbi:hypothetical protein ABZ885_41820, partial [Kitasatospora sp. NPDC047058]
TALLAARPLDLPEGQRPRYARLLTGLAGGLDEDTADSVLSALQAWAAYAPEGSEYVRRAATDLSRGRGVWHRAIGVVGALADSGLPHPVGGAAPGSLLHGTVTDLLAAVRAGEPDAEADHDLPAFQCLRRLVTMTVSSRPTLAALADLLADEPDLLPVRVSALTRALDPYADLPVFSAGLRALAAALRGHPALAGGTAVALRHLHSRNRSRGVQEATVLEAARRLVDGADGDGLAEGLLAVALLGAFGRSFHWPEPWRALLRTLRAHPAADVRIPAREVVTSLE